MKRFFFVFALLLFVVEGSSENPNPDQKLSSSPVHAELTSYGLPIGLLPSTNYLSYDVNKTSGHFAVALDGACKILLPPDNYLATYSKSITGKINHGKIAELKGISVRAFFKWWSITGIRSSGDNLVFEVGGITVKYPIKNFDSTLPCEGKHSSS